MTENTPPPPPPEQPGMQPPPPPPPPAPGTGPGYATATGPAAPMSDSEARLYATLAHVGQILFSFVAPLVIWLIGKERSKFVDDHGKEALNFSITVAIAYIVGGILSIIIIGVFIILAAWIASIVFGIQGAMAANKGEAYRYPFNIRLVK